MPSEGSNRDKATLPMLPFGKRRLRRIVVESEIAEANDRDGIMPSGGSSNSDTPVPKRRSSMKRLRRPVVDEPDVFEPAELDRGCIMPSEDAIDRETPIPARPLGKRRRRRVVLSDSEDDPLIASARPDENPSGSAGAEIGAACHAPVPAGTGGAAACQVVVVESSCDEASAGQSDFEEDEEPECAEGCESENKETPDDTEKSEDEETDEYTKLGLGWIPLEDRCTLSEDDEFLTKRRRRPAWLVAAVSSGPPPKRRRTSQDAPNAGTRKREKRGRRAAQVALSSDTQQNNPTVEDFFHFMKLREQARVRREIKQLPAEQWYSHGASDLMLRIKLNNVRRADDATTRLVRKVTDSVCVRWEAGQHMTAGPWNEEQQKLAGLLVFHCGLWRAFGSKEFIEAVGFLHDLDSWSKDSWARVVDMALACWRNGVYCFTDAYGPSRKYARTERKMCGLPDRVKAEATVRKSFEKVCQGLLKLWQNRIEIALTAERTRSWRGVIERIMAVKGYGGTGFLAKELTLDLLHTPLFRSWDQTTQCWRNQCLDSNAWCVVGPGARRGLDRLHGRPVGKQDSSQSQAVCEKYLQELLEVYNQRDAYWQPRALLDECHPAGELNLHDIQFSLCEFDKFERVRLRQGGARRYLPPREENQERQEHG